MAILQYKFLPMEHGINSVIVRRKIQAVIILCTGSDHGHSQRTAMRAGLLVKTSPTFSSVLLANSNEIDEKLDLGYRRKGKR